MLELLVAIKVYREKFIKENYRGTDHIFALVKSGSFEVTSPYGKHIVEANEGFLFKKNIYYQRRVITPVTLYLFRYKSTNDIFDREHIIFSDKERILSTLKMLEILDTGEIKDDFEYRKNFFNDLITQFHLENHIENSNRSENDELIELAIETIVSNLHKKLVLSEISTVTKLSYIQFLRRFKQYTGISPSDYIITKRLQKAKSLLCDTDLQIKEIATVCGFENEYYFSNFFKKHMGSSPSIFRKMTIYDDNQVGS